MGTLIVVAFILALAAGVGVPLVATILDAARFPNMDHWSWITKTGIYKNGRKLF